MNKAIILEKAEVLYPFGQDKVNLRALIGDFALGKISGKFTDTPSTTFLTALTETVRFLFLGAYSPQTLFFPGDKLIDDLWHSLIIETADYRRLCDRIRPGYFMNHSGILYTDYAKSKSPTELHEEQLSWLVSYVDNFGPITESAFPHLLLAKEISERLGLSRAQLNEFAVRIAAEVKKASLTTELDFDQFLTQEIKPQASALDTDSAALHRALKTLLATLNAKNPSLRPLLPTNSELERVYSVSGALAFTLWQHLAAVERLSTYPEWQERNAELWEEISSGNHLVGLATTHLAHPGAPKLVGKKNREDFLVSGTAPWVTGLEIFDSLLLAFDSDNEIVFSLIPFPSSLSTSSDQIQFERYQLACMNASNTFSMQVKSLHIRSQQIVFKFEKNVPRSPRATRYIFPELGLVDAVIDEIRRICERSTHPRHLETLNLLPKLLTRLQDLKSVRENIDPKDILEKTYKKDQLVHDAIRMLILTEGGSALLNKSIASRLYREALTLDVLIQDQKLIKQKLLDCQSD